MSETSYVQLEAAQADIPAIAREMGEPNESREGRAGWTLLYYDASIFIERDLSSVIDSGVPFTGEHGHTFQYSESGFCAVNGEYHEWPLLNGRPCASLVEDEHGRLVPEPEELQRLRRCWMAYRTAAEQIAKRRPKKKPARTPD